MAPHTPPYSHHCLQTIPDVFKCVAEEVEKKAKTHVSAAHFQKHAREFTGAKSKINIDKEKLPHNTLKSYLLNANDLAKFGRQILVEDLMHALRFLES